MFIGGCFLLALLLCFTIDLSDRGRHFAAAQAKTDRTGTYDLKKARTLARVVGHIRSHYVDPSRVDAKEMAVAAMQRVQQQVPEVMVKVERDKKKIAESLTVSVEDQSKTFGLDRVEDLYELNWKLMDVFEFLERHLPQLVDLEELEYAAINGLLSTLDPHSLLLSPRIYREMQIGTKGRFGGLGIVVAMDKGVLTVTSVLADTPAGEAGLLADDKIVQINAESTINMSLNESVNLLRGQVNSDVTVWIRRKGWDAAKPFTMTRREITLPSVDHSALGDGIGYVRIRSFQDNTSDNLAEALNELEAGPDGLKGLVMDLRDNPGGLLDKAIAVSDMFLASGTVVTTVREGSRERDESYATHANTRGSVPIVVLINRGSASASEIVAGALKHNNRAVILGTTSFGKGSVQVIYKIDEAALKLTVAQYLTPGDISIQSVGIVPDIEIQALSVDKDELDIHPAALTSRGESALSSHLNSARTVDTTPSVQLRVLQTDATAYKRSRRGEDFKADGLTLLAKDLVIAAPSPNRKQQLVQAANFVTQRQAREVHSLVEKLGKQEIDWQEGRNSPSPKLVLTTDLKPVEGETLRAGTKAILTATVHNRGSKPVHRVHATVSSELASLHDRELAFGRVEPDAKVTKTLEVRLSKSAAAGGAGVKVSLLSDGESLNVDETTVNKLAALPRPTFAHTVRILDPTGNGDGLLQRGETVTLEARVTNVGAGKAHKVLATLKNESGPEVFITVGRVELGELAPGASAIARFEFEVKQALKARQVLLKLKFGDPSLRVWANASQPLRVFPAGFAPRTQENGLATIGKTGAKVRTGAHRDALIIGDIAADATVRFRGRAGIWVEIEWPAEDGNAEAVTGWIDSADTSALTPAGSATAPELTPTPVKTMVQHRPPELVMEPAAIETKSKTVRIKGLARFFGAGQSRRHMYIFRGDQKLFFKSARSADTLRDEVEFDAELPLDKGDNSITIVARQGDDDVTTQQLTVHRR